ncbi:uncharacterized protein DDB_G0283357 [Calliphora vicina]|uniref:uncharacterized protein DDB_G0283357 n=1 Tax=Calliphora vicina TaxID=7373 RepID=UPI00325BB8AC
MAPTICSGKKRQTRTIATTNIRRHGQGSHQLNQALSNIVNYVAKGSMNNRVTASLRIQPHNQTERNSNNNTSLNYSHSMQTSATSAVSNHRHQLFSYISDNAVTSSTHSDTENSYDLRLANDSFTNSSTATYGSNTTNPSTSTSQSSSSLSESTTSSSPSHRETTSASTSQPCGEERRFQRYASVVLANNNMAGQGECLSNGNDVTDLYEDENDKVSASHKDTNQIHSSNMRNHYYACNEFDSEEEYDELEDARELNSDMSGGDDSDTGMDTDEADSMTSLDTEKSAKLKRGNHPLLRDKLLAKQQTDNSNNHNNNNTKSLTNIRNTDGLLSIAIKTIKLVKRNQLLQQRLTQLQLETSEFIQSVLANPENRHFRENIKQKVQEVENV